jgi:SET domain-containing protein
MKTELRKAKLIVKQSPIQGYGVFAEQSISKGEVIEECHTLRSTYRDDAFIDYYFAGGEDDQVALNVLPLGYGCIYNHADDPNASYCFDVENNLFTYTARRLITKGEEIFVSYGDTWFAQRDIILKKTPRSIRALRYLRGMPLRATLVCTAVTLLVQAIRLHLLSA